MRLCNDTITVFNRKLDVNNGWDVYIPTVIHNVSWYWHVVSSVGDKGLNADNQCTIRIPMDADFGGKSYVDPRTYKAETIVSGLFTLEDGDKVVKGDAGGTTLTMAQLEEQYHDCITILGVTDNRRAPNAPHFRVVGS